MTTRFSTLKAGMYIAGIATFVGLLAIPVMADTTSTTTTTTTTSMAPSDNSMIDYSGVVGQPATHPLRYRPSTRLWPQYDANRTSCGHRTLDRCASRGDPKQDRKWRNVSFSGSRLWCGPP